MDILKELKRITNQLDRFPRHTDLVNLKEFKLRNKIVTSGTKISEFAKQLGYDTAKPKGYWTEDRMIEEFNCIIKENNGWPSSEMWNTQYSYLAGVCYKKNKSMKHYREKLKVNKLAKAKEKKCAYCETIFLPVLNSNWKRQKFCCKACRTDYYRVKQNERNAQHIKQPKICPICNKTFIPQQTSKQKYCKRSCHINFRKRMDKALRRCLEATNQSKLYKSESILGYTAKDLLEHLQSHSNWKAVQNKSWHLDHIFPVRAFIDYGILDIALICCLDNLQPLLAKQNILKADKYNKKEFEAWLATS